MNTPPSQAAPSLPRPNLISCVRKGFDAVANHVELLLFPLFVDLFLWLGPHFTIRSMTEGAIKLLNEVIAQEGSLPEEAVAASQQTWQYFAEHFNLLAFLRTLPVGVPSLMATHAPINTPFGAPNSIELTEFAAASGLVILVVLIGLFMGSLFYLLVAQVSITNQIHWGAILQEWPKAALKSTGLLFALLGALVAVTLPVSCLVGTLAISGVMFSQIGMFLYGVILAWWMFPLVFSAHGIFLYRDNLLLSIRRSIRLTRLTFPLTGTLILLLLLFSEGLDILWKTPKVESWLMLLGVGGHAFIATAFLAVSFVYFHETNRWLQSLPWGSFINPNRRMRV